MEFRNHFFFALVLSIIPALPAYSAKSLPEKIPTYADENLVLTVTPAKPLESAGEMGENLLRTAVNREWNVDDDDLRKSINRAVLGL